MKQLSQNLRTGKLSVDEVTPPFIQPGQVLIQTAYSLISAGTERTKIETGRKSLLGKALARPDQVRQVITSTKSLGLQATYEKVKTRLDSRSPLGYSAAGIVIQVGEGVNEFRPGDHAACGGATAAHSEVMVVPKNLCVKVPEKVSLMEAAFTTVGAIAMQGIRQADMRLGECVVVIGLGLLGQLTVQIIKASGCYAIGYDLDVRRCQLAEKLGANAAVTNIEILMEQLAAISGSRGADAVIITAGSSSNQPVELAGELSRDKGRVVIVGAVGLTIPRELYYQKELDLKLSRSYGPGRYDPVYEEKGIDYPYGYVRWTEHRNMEAFLNLVATGSIKLEQLITHRFKIDQAEAAYNLISDQKHEPYLGVLFEYDLKQEALQSRIEIKVKHQAVEGRVTIGIIGAGNFAQSMLLPHLKKNPDAFLQSITTASTLQSRDVADRFNIDSVTSSAAEIFQDPGIKAVLIATRHDTHADLAVQALVSGKAIHLEKPLALNNGQLDRVVDAYQEALTTEGNSPFLMVGFNRRFAPMVQNALHFFSSRQEGLAMLYRVNAGYLPLEHWTQDPEQGGGRIIGEICHFIDIMQFFAGAKVNTIQANALANVGKYYHDNISINLTFMDGSIGTILYVANGDKALAKEYLEIYCAGKTAILRDFQDLTLFTQGRKRISRTGRQDKGHSAEVSAWVDAIHQGQSEPVPFDDAVTATRATFAVLQSLTNGQKIFIDQ